jgi:hypothetical protein
MLDKLKNLFGKKPEQKTESTTPRAKKEKRVELTPKEAATQAGEPYISILKVDVDPENINNGSFELDWNDKFVANLVRAGYQAKPNEEDSVIVDRWFQTVCRNIALEVYEQQMADPTNRDGLRDVRPPAVRRDIGGGRSEMS